MRTMEELAAVAMEQDEPCIMFVAAEDEALLVALDGNHPLDVMADAVGAGLHPRAVEAVAILVGGTAREMDSHEPVGRVMVAAAISRTDSAAVMLSAEGVTTPMPNGMGGAVLDAVRDFLGD